MTIREKKKAFNRILFRWHKTHYRDMPWRPKFSDRRELKIGSDLRFVYKTGNPFRDTPVVRRTHNPYRILVSEIMLQQTQVDRVRGKFAEFLKKFPNFPALAQAPLGEVLRAWSGLGYNRRARYLHDCARKIVREHGGKFPATMEELRTLPGIGLSTAGALLAFAFEKDEPMIDTNIRRILTRVFFAPRSKKNTRRKPKIQGGTLGNDSPRFHLVPFHRVPCDQELYVFARSLIPKGKGRAWNYAMLDLGATLCTARNHSPKCPLMKLHGEVGDFRYKNPQKKFAGSNRFYRGRVLSYLATDGMMTISSLSKRLQKTPRAIRQLVQSLKRERLIAVVHGKVFLPRHGEKEVLV